MSITIKDIAKVASVSYATVSRALSGHPEVSEKTKQYVCKLAKEMGYTPNAIAKGLVTKNTNTLGVIIPDITNPFFPEVAQGVEDCANRNGYQVFLCNSSWQLEKEKKYLDILYGKRVDGIVIAPSSNNIEHLIGRRYKDIPIVFAAYNPKVDGCDYVVIDDYKSAKIAVEYLLKLGHKRIAFIGGQKGNNTNRGRVEGYSDTLKEHGIPVDKSYIKYGKFIQKSGYELTKEILLNNELPTAILAGNDIIALGIIQAIEEFGMQVPENISVMGFDDISFASLDKVQLTTVFQPKYEIGELCVETLLKIIKNEDEQTNPIILDPKLMIRKTCRAI